MVNARKALDSDAPVIRDDKEGQSNNHIFDWESGWGCDTSNCGTCVVLMDGEPVKSCTVLAASAAGQEVRTVEGLEVDGVPDPVQQGFHEMHGLQCGTVFVSDREQLGTFDRVFAWIFAGISDLAEARGDPNAPSVRDPEPSTRPVRMPGSMLDLPGGWPARRVQS